MNSADNGRNAGLLVEICIESVVDVLQYVVHVAVIGIHGLGAVGNGLGSLEVIYFHVLTSLGSGTFDGVPFCGTGAEYLLAGILQGLEIGVGETCGRTVVGY